MPAVRAIITPLGILSLSSPGVLSGDGGLNIRALWDWSGVRSDGLCLRCDTDLGESAGSSNAANEPQQECTSVHYVFLRWSPPHG